MGPYNGFSGPLRAKSAAWVRRQLIKGTFTKPTQCAACGQNSGIIDSHAEDYSEPFGPHIYAFALCFSYHMMVHCRFKNPKAWDAYILAINCGRRLKDGYEKRSIGGFNAQLLHTDPMSQWEHLFVEQGIVASTLLMDIGAGKFDPRNMAKKPDE